MSQIKFSQFRQLIKTTNVFDLIEAEIKRLKFGMAAQVA